VQNLDSCLQIGLIGGVNRVLAPHALDGAVEYALANVE